MRIDALEIPDVIRIEPEVYRDRRGFFFEAFQDRTYAEIGIVGPLVQHNYSGSHAGVLRGLHYQLRNPQGKLIAAAVGEIFDVAVDLRRHAPTFGKWVGTRLSAENRYQLWVPPGFAHGLYVLSPWAEVTYQVSDYYNPEWERTLLWNDADVGIAWPLIGGVPPILSPKDAQGMPLRQAATYGEL